eukprot:Protomagalhaensia_wolfi_Nauph_80__1253@NODE_173_length_3305_cov_36_500000_g130_i0_p2_GENE_NODE_173_length_3305_cov_36_500000_g130_i0NODE_173_length_3305_cov_36_500000_g130_i0_p2_ORF_typecomplete_len364_score74_70RPW8/PF05659_11/0_11COMP/PF11598_8/0_59Sulfatase_C/PF14707_6/0_78Sulfatase_C/PF14707_6/1_6e04Sulfatase_C/PF14707_6/4_4e02DUF1515/PF07439_11/0_51DUF1515/PF07439_11/2e02Cytochrom_C_2/PF01322_20/8_9Cytochrom_C_2/PF01322_20/20CCDC158/PF15921_5/66CCDC158/PF15921_5/7_1HeLo/PF14479_6/5_3MCPsign
MWGKKKKEVEGEPLETTEDPESQAGGKDETTGSSPANRVPPALNFYGKQIEELLIKVIRIEASCLGEGNAETEENDEFVHIKKIIYSLLFQTKQNIREKYDIQSREGNTVKAIQLGSQINKQVDQMNQEFVTLKEAFKKQAKRANKAGPKVHSKQNVSNEELDIRFKEMQVIKRQIEECKELVKRGTEIPERQVITLTDFLGQMEKAGVAPPAQFDRDGQGWREPTAEEKAAMDRWAARDKDFDRQIFEVGDVVDRLNVLAVEIGNKAEQQGKMAIELSRQADEANQEVIEVNSKLKSIMMKGNGMNFCCKLLLTVILIAMLGFIAQNVTTRIKRSMGLARRLWVEPTPSGAFRWNSGLIYPL